MQLTAKGEEKRKRDGDTFTKISRQFLRKGQNKWNDKNKTKEKER